MRGGGDEGDGGDKPPSLTGEVEVEERAVPRQDDAALLRFGLLQQRVQRLGGIRRLEAERGGHEGGRESSDTPSPCPPVSPTSGLGFS